MVVCILFLACSLAWIGWQSPKLSDEVSDSILVPENEYYWTGKVTQGENGITLIFSDIQSV
jgi:hypothetical protein